jgi:AcrR family transcriptional regulator
MQPNITGNNQNARERTFTERARRKQIVAATIEVLAERGYVNTSFARIAERAGINAGLISYHFKNKDDLTNEVYQSIYQARLEHLQERIAHARTATEKLRLALEADLSYMGTQPKLFRALIEVLFSQRNEQGLPKYMKDVDSPLLSLLLGILKEGQHNGEFGDFDAYNLALVLEGARDQFLAQLPTRPSLDLTAFIRMLVRVALQSVKEADGE